MCHDCKWWKRLICFVACDEVNEELERMEVGR